MGIGQDSTIAPQVEPLNKGDVIPLYYQIGQALKEQIHSGKLRPGTKLPPEEELARQYGVAKLTLRNALSKLAQEGLIRRHKGKGTFVAERALMPEKIISIILDFENNNMPSPMSKILSGILMRVNLEENYRIRVDSAADLPALIALRQSGEAQIDGVITIRLHDRDQVVTQLNQAGIPFVVEGQTGSFNSVEIDNQASMVKAFEYLQSLGHRRIGIGTTEDRKNSHVAERYQIARELVERAGGALADEAIHVLQVDGAVPAAEQTRAFLRRPRTVTAMLCTTDVVALSLITQAPFVGVQVPEDLSVLGFDDMEACQFVHPPLSSLRQDYLQHGYKAAKLLIDKISDCNHRKQQFRVVPELIVRHSCTSPK